MEVLVVVGVAEIRQVERVAVAAECRVLGKLEEVLDMVVLPKWKRSGPCWSPKNRRMLSEKWKGMMWPLRCGLGIRTWV